MPLNKMSRSSFIQELRLEARPTDHLSFLQPHRSPRDLLPLSHDVPPAAEGHRASQEPTPEAAGEQHLEGGEVQLGDELEGFQDAGVSLRLRGGLLRCVRILPAIRLPGEILMIKRPLDV